MTVKEIVYFDRPGPQNTDAVMEAVKKEARGTGDWLCRCGVK